MAAAALARGQGHGVGAHLGVRLAAGHLLEVDSDEVVGVGLGLGAGGHQFAGVGLQVGDHGRGDLREAALGGLAWASSALVGKVIFWADSWLLTVLLA